MKVWHDVPEATRSHLLQLAAAPGWVGLGTDGPARGEVRNCHSGIYNRARGLTWCAACCAGNWCSGYCGRETFDTSTYLL